MVLSDAYSKEVVDVQGYSRMVLVVGVERSGANLLSKVLAQ
jgi:hypothetical protein